jgi:DNA-directed RNA polymerase specialized sigma24 family protein
MRITTENIDPNILSEVLHHAEQGAIAITPISEIIDEVKGEIGLRFVQKICANDPPRDHKAWAFISGKHETIRILKYERRYMPLPASIDSILQFDPHSNPEQHRQQIGRSEAITALIQLVNIATTTMAATGDDIDRQIIHMHFIEGKKFSEIAIALGIKEDCAKRRSARLILRFAAEIRKAVSSDSSLSSIFAAMLSDQTDFHRSILGLLALVSAKGITAIETTLQRIFGE